MATSNGWYGVDLDGTLAVYDGWKGPGHIGEPIPLMVARVQAWKRRGIDVRIFTARVSEASNEALVRHNIKAWCKKHLGYELPITNVKDYGMLVLYDDRAVQVEKNTGILITDTMHVH